MAIYYGPAEKSNILSRLNGIYMGSPTKEVNWNDFGIAADVYVGGFTNPKTAVLQDEPKFPSGGDWRYECTFKTGTDVTTKQGIFGQYPRPLDFLLPVLGIRNGKFELFLSSTGTSWDIASNVQPAFAIEANTVYGVILKCTYKSNQYTYSLYANKTWTSDLNDNKIWTLTTDKRLYDNAYYAHRAYISWGNNSWGVNAQAPFLGTINITKCAVYGYGTNLIWSGTGRLPKVSKVVANGKNIKSVVAAYNSGFGSYFGNRGYMSDLYRIGFSTATETAHSVHLLFDLTNPKVVKVSDYPVSLPTSDGFELGFEVAQTVNGKPTGLRQRVSGKLFDLNDAATALANEKCFGVIDGVDTTGIYLGFVEQGSTTPLWGIACRNKLKTGQRVSVFSLYTGNDKVSRVQLKTDGCLYYSTSVYNQSLITDVTSYLKDSVTWSDELTRQYLGYNGEE